MARDFYAVLAVAKTASDDQIRLRFRQLARERHPDRFAGEQKQAAEVEFQEITQAFNVLNDHERRRQYDMDLAKRQEVPSDPKQVGRVFLQRGIKAYREKNLVEAVDNFDRATRADPTNGMAWYNLAMACCQNTGWLPRAASAIEKACELEAMNAGYWRQAGRILALAGRNERAAAAYRKAIDWGEDDPVVRKALEELEPGTKRGLFGKPS
jgi:curved DNA-binding protein CbpA